MILDVFLTVCSTLWMLVVYFIKATAIIGNDEIQKNICTLNENIVITEFQAVCLKYCIKKFCIEHEDCVVYLYDLEKLYFQVKID